MYNFIVVGGGIIGMSTSMQLKRAYPEAKILVVEKEDGPGRHQSSHNSGVIHAGVYYKPGSLKANFCLQGNLATKQFCNKESIKYDVCGKLLVATTPEELERMRALWERSAANGLERSWLGSAELFEREPNISGLGAIFVPSTGIVDYGEMTAIMARNFLQSGGEILYNAEVTGITEGQREVVVQTSQGDFICRYMVSCSGLMADRMIRMLGLVPDFSICPFRGEYYLLSPEHNQIVSHLIYPIPDPSMPFLGVHLTRMINGTVTVGPNAVLALKREGYRKSDISLSDTLETLGNPSIRKVLGSNLRAGLREMKNSLFKSAYLSEVRKYCPSLSIHDLNPYPAGVRAQAVSRDGKLIDDFLFVDTARTVNVCNAPSPAATSAIPIGAFIVERVKQQVGGF